MKSENIKVGSVVELVSTAWTDKVFGLEGEMARSGIFTVCNVDGVEVFLIGQMTGWRDEYWSWHINDLKLVSNNETK